MADRTDIINYLSGNLEKGERQKFEENLQSSPELRKEMIAYREVWNLSDELSYPEQNTDTAWEQFKITVKAPKKKLGFDWLKVAASVLVLAALTIGIYSYQNGGNQSYASTDHIQKITLTDQSVIQLNENSTLTEYNGFNEDHRKLKLSGEAFFDIEKANHPLEVEVSGGIVRVLGTQFNILTLEDENYLAVELYEGRVEFEGYLGETNMLVPGQRLILNNGDLAVQDISDNAAQWLSQADHITCSDVPLKHIMVELKKAYNVDYKLDKKLLDEHYTVVLPRDDLTSCLNILSKISSKRFILDNKVIRVQ